MAKVDPSAFLQSVRDSFARPPNDLAIDTSLRNLPDWDSLASVMLVAEILSQYGVMLTGSEMRTCLTPGDILRLVESKTDTDN